MALYLSKRTVLISPTKLLHFSSAATSSPPPPPSSDDPTVTAAVTILKHHRSKSRWSHLRTLTPTPFTPSQFTQITLHLRNNPHLALRFFKFTIQHSLCQHTLLSYATIIHVIARSRQKSETLTLIQSTIHKFDSPILIFKTLIKTYRLCDSAPFVFDLLIKACIRSNRIDHGVKIARMLISKGIFLLISTCNSLIMSVCKNNGSIAGFELYNELFREFIDKKVVLNVSNVPNVHTYNIIMHAFYRDGLISKLESMWNDMIVNECVPNEYSYSVLMAVYCDNGSMYDAVKVWDKMKENGIKYDVMCYNTIIGGFCEVGDMNNAEEFFKEMRLGKVESSCFTYERLIYGYCKIEDVDSAMRVYKEMCAKGFELVGGTVDVLIKVLCGKRKVCEALMVLKVAMKGNDASVKGESYEDLIKGLCEEGRMDEGMKLQAEMVGRGFEPSSGIYCAFIEGYEKQGNMELAGQLRSELLGIQ